MTQRHIECARRDAEVARAQVPLTSAKNGCGRNRMPASSNSRYLAASAWNGWNVVSTSSTTSRTVHRSVSDTSSGHDSEHRFERQVPTDRGNGKRGERRVRRKGREEWSEVCTLRGKGCDIEDETHEEAPSKPSTHRFQTPSQPSLSSSTCRQRGTATGASIPGPALLAPLRAPPL
jgi:hypothetical protein